MAYAVCETWEQIVLLRIYEQGGIESPSSFLPKDKISAILPAINR